MTVNDPLALLCDILPPKKKTKFPWIMSSEEVKRFFFSFCECYNAIIPFVCVSTLKPQNLP